MKLVIDTLDYSNADVGYVRKAVKVVQAKHPTATASEVVWLLAVCQAGCDLDSFMTDYIPGAAESMWPNVTNLPRSEAE